MIIWGNIELEKQEEVGDFHCPACNCERKFELLRTRDCFHLFFIPLGQGELLQERIRCQSCRRPYPVTLLAWSAPTLASPEEAARPASEFLLSNFGNVVALTDSAAEEIRRRHLEGDFETSLAVRIEPVSRADKEIAITFDTPIADGRDWLGAAHGLPLVVDRRSAPDLVGTTIDFRDGQFYRD
ncbi:hypothetical protein [Lignipirellula cremea]|uniref:Zinc-ribbon 15 domain-containing protein n=1 Tax=Lignipirellula cremea TaxID=2528010 RepID=A0A518DT00_9BACT|nr:hypothetical protein [Lignipirellula cremea]QDU94928.1 hypothetical protein Pla8534_27360 [Lignipirellula cremea]